MGKPTSPSFTHTATLTPSKTARVGRAAGQSGTQTVTELMDNDAGFKITVPIRQGSVPEVHAHATVSAIRRGHEVCIVVSRTILGISDHGVVLSSSASEVVLLEVPRHLVETVSVA